MRREARIGFAIVGCLAAILMYAAVKRMWLLAQVARDSSPAPTIPVASISAKSALEPVITLPEQPTSTAVYQEPGATGAETAEPAVPFPSRFAIPMKGSEEPEQVAAIAGERKADEPAAAPVEVDTTPIEAAPPLGRFASRFSAPPANESVTPEPAKETVTPQTEAMASIAADPVAAIKSRFSTNPVPAPQAAEEKSNANNPMPIMSSAGSLLGSLASRLASNMTTPSAEESTPSQSLEPTITLPSASTEPPQPAATTVAESAPSEASPQASLRIVGEKPSEPQAETPPTAKLIKPAPLVEAQPLPSRPVVTAAPRDMPTTTRPTWKAGETKIEPVSTPIATTPKPQPRLNRAFASTAASASIPTTYVPAQNASSTKVVTTDDAMPHRLPPTIEVASDTDKGVTKEADPAWVQQMIQSGSFIPGQRFVPTQTPQPLPIGQQSAQPLANPAQPSAGAITPTQTQPTTYVVQPGDDLATIARRTLGDAARWGELFRLNRNVIGDYPDQMKPGMTLRLPQ